MTHTMTNSGFLQSYPSFDTTEIHSINNNNAIVMFSGGIDSSVSLLWALDHYKNVEALVVDYNQQHSIELEKAFKLIKIYGVKHRTIKVTFPEDFWGIKNRLTRGQACLMTSIAALNISHEGADIVHGILRTDDYGDCNREFLDTIADVLFHPDDKRKIGIATPLRAVNGKAEVFALAYIYGIPVDLTWTCRSPFKNQPCGQCVQCKQRYDGFEKFLKQFNLSKDTFYEWQSVFGSPYHPEIVSTKGLHNLSKLFLKSGAMTFSKPCYLYLAPDGKKHIATQIRYLKRRQFKKNGKMVRSISAHGYFEGAYRWEVVILEDGTVATTRHIPDNDMLEKALLESITNQHL